MKENYYKYGLEYYLSGRNADINGYIDVAPNIFHHSLELILKGSLLESFTSKELKDKFGHDLKLLWRTYKRKYPEKELVNYDELIENINLWEEVRYPTTKGFAKLNGKPLGKGKLRGVKLYHYDRKDIDKFLAEFFEREKINPKFFSMLLFKKMSRENYLVDNDNPFLV